MYFVASVLILTSGISAGVVHGQMSTLPGRPAHAKPALHSIQRVDFQTFSYRDEECSRGKTIHVRKGSFTEGAGSDERYFHVDQVLYGDVTGDGVDEAVVLVSCGLTVANFFSQEVFVFTLRAHAPYLLGTIDENVLSRDYQRYYAQTPHTMDGTLWGVEAGPGLAAGVLSFEHYADGPHCCPKNIVTLRYRWEGTTFVLIEPPTKRPVQPNQ